VAEDRRRELRRLLVLGGGVGVVAVLDGVDDVGGQLAGDGLLLALATDTPGAGELARRCAAALRDRGWEGDEELAAQLNAARRALPAAHSREIPVDLDALADLFDGGVDSAGGRVDLVTGEVWPDLGMDDPGLDDQAEDLEDGGRWLFVHPIGSRSAYRDMLNFIATRTDRDLIGRLEVAVDGPGAFRRFRNVLSDWPEDRDD
jgi:hypothetical protein